MGWMNSRLWRILIMMAALTALVACGADSEPEAEVTLVIPTVVAEVDVTAAPEAILTEPAPRPTDPPPPTMAPADPTPEPAEVTPTAEVEATPADPAIEIVDIYRVAFVEESDVLNVRAGSGVDFDIVGELQPDATGINITGQGQVVEGSVWVPIETGRISGWVNSLFLTRDMKNELACDIPAVQQLMADLATALSEQDNNALANLIHPERGIHIHYNWWSDEVWLRQDEIEILFTDTTDYTWGVQDGSGLEQIGTFSEIMLPMLQADLLVASEFACNELLNGGTAGLVILPEGFEQFNFRSFYRPFPEDGFEMDWGSWAVGFEEWDGNWYITYLVHYQWEI